MGLESITKFINAVSFFDAFSENEKKVFGRSSLFY